MRNDVLIKCGRYALWSLVVGATAITACARTDAKPPDADSAASASGAGFTIPAAQRARLHVIPVVLSVFRPVVATTGTVAFNGDHSTQVLAPVSGPVSRILVPLGAQVARGSALATVSSPDFAAAVAAFRKAESSYRQLSRVAALDEELFKTDAIAHRDVEQAQTDAAAAAADRDASLQQLHALGVDAATIAAIQAGKSVGPVEAVIRAPISGTVVEKLINPGQLLQAGTTPTFTVADVSSMWVTANVFESDLAAVRKGANATISTDAGKYPIPGVVDNVADLVDPNTKATAVRIVAPNPSGVLKRDMFVRVAIQADAQQSGFLVPTSAVLRNEENLPFVFVALPAGGFNRRQITLGPRVGDGYQVLTGLTAGDKVVTEGALFLQFAESQ
ncbi:MAG TPA: efflux RND transporter periplasmic adaptor subunit [Gemmatimonadaceae bacterium]